MDIIASLKEITMVAQEVQRVLGSINFPGDKVTLDEVIVEVEARVEEVTVCRPCRVYTHGQEKPKWAIHRCPEKKHRRNKLLEPQLPESEKPATKQWRLKIRQNGKGFSCIHPECIKYTKIFPLYPAAQQHAKEHYPPEYKCQDCNGDWYLKTQYNQHFLIPCPDCNKLFMKGSLLGHKGNCKHKKNK